MVMHLQDGDDLLNEEDMIDVFKRLFRLATNMDAAKRRGGVSQLAPIT